MLKVWLELFRIIFNVAKSKVVKFRNILLIILLVNSYTVMSKGSANYE